MKTRLFFVLLMLVATVACASTNQETFYQYASGRQAADKTNTDDSHLLAVQAGRVVLQPYSSIQQGIGVVDSKYSNFASAVTVALNNKQPLYITKTQNITVNADLSNITKVIIAGGSFNISASVTLTMPSNFDYERKQCFSGSGTVLGLSQARFEWWGAKKDNINDDTSAIQAAIFATIGTKGVILGSNGTYKITSSINLSDGVLNPPNFKGESAKGVIFAPTMSGTTPCFIDKRTVMSYPSKSIWENFTVAPATPYTGTAIELSAAINDIFRNVFIKQANYGVWYYDNSGPNTWTETNNLEEVWIDYCNNALRFEKGTGNGSFHGNNFYKVFINIGANQTAINHVSGYWYNSYFGFHLWGTSNTSVIVNANGNAEHNSGFITLELLASAGATQSKITGGGRFWYDGVFNYTGGSVVDNAQIASDGSGIFVCNNYRYTTTMQDSHLTGFTPYISTFTPEGTGNEGKYNGRDSLALWKLIAPGNTSFLLNGSGGSLFTSNSNWNQSVETAAQGFEFKLDGSAITTSNPNGFSFLTGPSKYAYSLLNGEFYISSLDRNTKIVSLLGNPNTNVPAGPGSIGIANAGGVGQLWLKQTGTDSNGWVQVGVSGDAATVGGFTPSKTPAANQIPVIDSSSNEVLPGNMIQAGNKLAIGGTTTSNASSVIFSKTIPISTNQDLLLAYNDFYSGVVTVSYYGTGRTSVKSFTFSGSNGHIPTSSDYTKLRSYYATTNSLGTPYVKVTTDGNLTPHLFIPITNAVSNGVVTVTFISDIEHHPWLLPSGPGATLNDGVTYPLTGL